MAQRIRILSPQTIDQIAAGEVIENPASVVKELVENSIDAGSTSISISIRGGGLEQIVIRDDGCGMSQDDAILCFERHATSKIGSSADLFSIGTMGFRGEALSSIASIAKVTLTTAEEGKSGTVVEVDGGKIVSVGPAAREKGTTITVRVLFYNVPARRKFQRSSSLCGAEVARVVSGLALAHPEIAFSLQNGGTELFSLRKETLPFLDLLKKRGEVLIEPLFVSPAKKIELELEGMCLSGWIGEPMATRPNRTGQHFFTNRRAISSNLLGKALRDGYGTRLDTGRFPLCLLHLTLPQEEVDVNVHPQKREVRFLHEERVKRLIEKGVAGAFAISLPPLSFPKAVKGEETFLFKADLPVFCAEEPKEEPPTLFFEEKKVFPVAIGLFQRYLFVHGSSLPELGEEEGILLFDLDALYSRLLYEKLLRHKAAQMAQGILVPIVLSFPPAESEKLRAVLPSLTELGFALRPFGTHTYALESVPSFLALAQIESVLRDLVAQIDEELAADLLQKAWAKRIAYRAKGQKKDFVVQEGIELIKEIWKEGYPLDGLDGKPLYKALGCDDLSRLFEK